MQPCDCVGAPELPYLSGAGSASELCGVEQAAGKRHWQQTARPPPAETHVLVGWYKDEAHLQWILREKLYNFRMDTGAGSLRLKPEVSGAQYLLLHSHKGATSQCLMRVSKEGPRVFSREALVAKRYPREPSKPFIWFITWARQKGLRAMSGITRSSLNGCKTANPPSRKQSRSTN